MIRVTVELVPRGDERAKQEIGRLEIANTGDDPNRPRLGSYTVKFATIRGKRTVGIHQRHISGFPRLKYNVWALIHEALDQLKWDSSGHIDEAFESDEDIDAQDTSRRFLEIGPWLAERHQRRNH